MERGKSIDLFLMGKTRAKNNTAIMNDNGGQPKTWL
jgi:hypothetical protein